MAPSGQDIKNSAIGIAIILIVGVLILWSKITFAVFALLTVTRVLGMGIALGFVFGMIAFVVSIPLALIYIKRLATNRLT
jgi:uncharacterized membrane protein required for colicin V production